MERMKNNMNIIEFIVEDGLVMIPFLYIIGEIIIKTEIVKSNLIPLLLLMISFIFTPFLLGGFTAENIVQAGLVAGFTVFTDQVIKQVKEIV